MKKECLIIVLTMLITLFSLKGYAQNSIRTQIETKDQVDFSVIDSVATREFGKNAEFIFESDSVTVNLIAWGQNAAQSEILPKWMTELVRYVLCSPAMYKSNKKIYSRFEPYAWLTFYGAKGNVMLLLDYSINKWMVKDGNGEILFMYDLPNKDLLLMLRLLFPKSELINIKYNELIQTL